MDEQYFTVKEVAERLRYQEETIRQEIKDKRLRALRIRGDYRIGAEDLAVYIRRVQTMPREDEVAEEEIESELEMAS